MHSLSCGIIAFDFPPMVGGMEAVAHGLALGLAKRNRVTVFTRHDNVPQSTNSHYEVHPMLRGNVHLDFELLKSVSPDLWIILNSGYAPLSRLLKEPVFCYCHGSDFLKPWIQSGSRSERAFLDKLKQTPLLWRLADPIDARVRKKDIRKGLREAANLFANSEFTASILQRKVPDLRRPPIICYPGVSEHFFVPIRTKHLSDPATLRILTIARLAVGSRRKNVDGVLRALALLRNEIDFIYTVIGDGDMRSDLERLARDLGIASSVQFAGRVSDEDIMEYLDGSDLFVLTAKGNLGDIEGFGIVYAEAGARGVPSILSRAGGAVDAVQDGVTGIVLEGSEPEDIAQGILRFLAIRDSLTPEAIRAFAEQFRWQNITEHFENQLRAAMTETHSPDHAGAPVK